MAKNVPLALVVAGMLVAMALLLGVMALYQDKIAKDDDGDTDVEVEEATILYEDEFVKIEYLGNDMYRFTALQPDDFDQWGLFSEAIDEGSSDNPWTYELEADSGIYGLVYRGFEHNFWYEIDTGDITAYQVFPT